MRTCFLHVGTPKTGSTMIQGFLSDAKERLAERGLGLPLFPQGDLVDGAAQLVLDLDGETDPASPKSAGWRWLDRWIATGSGDFCISHENFATALARPGRLAFVKAFFARRGVGLTIIAYVREPVGRINAAYTQRAKNLRVAQPFDLWAESIAPETVQKFSPQRTFAEIVGDRDVRFVARSFDARRDRLLIDFLELVGQGDIDVSGYQAGARLNASPGPKATATGVMIRRELEARGERRSARLDYLDAFGAAVAARGWDERPFFGPSPELAERLAARFSAENDAFAMAVWGRPWKDCVPAVTRAQNVFDPSNATAAERAEVEDVVRETLARGGPPSLWRKSLRKLGIG